MKLLSYDHTTGLGPLTGDDSANIFLEKLKQKC